MRIYEITTNQVKIGQSLAGDNGTKIEIPGGYIDIQHSNLKFAPRSQSVIDFVVEPDSRGKGVGTKLLQYAMEKFHDMGAQVSSAASVKVFYNAGFRNPAIPTGSFADHERMRQADSSVFMAQNPVSQH
jgi:GNAT superfamily N-acetyltransferase